MLRNLLIFIFLIYSSSSYSGEHLFKNLSGYLLTCDKYAYGDYNFFFVLDPDASRTYSNLDRNARMRCFYTIEPHRSTTVFTYFNLHSSGEYDFYMIDVNCDKCSSGSRWGTLVIPPSGGSPVYNRLK